MKKNGFTAARSILIHAVILAAVSGCGGGGGGTPSSASSGSGTGQVPPSISTQPQSQTVTAGAMAIFSVTANGTSPLAYQWSAGGAPISGATSSTYMVSAAGPEQSGLVLSVKVSNEAGAVTSSTAQLIVNPSVTATTNSATSGTLSANSPSISLASIATVDFTGQSALMGQTASVAQITDSAINTIASDVQDDLGVTFGDATAIVVAVPSIPSGTVKVTVNAPTVLAALTDSQAATVYIYSSAGDSGDGDDTLTPLDATLDATAGTITVNLPGGYFLPVSGTSSFVATLKVGTATATSTPPPSVQSSVGLLRNLGGRESMKSSTSTGGLTIPCPLTQVGCTERSRFNPARYLNGAFHPHWGMDLVAPVGTSIFVPKGGKPYHAFTPTQYQNDTASLACPSAECAKINGRAGILLAIDYGTYKVRLLHLSSIDASLLNADGTLNTSTTTDGITPVAETGATGAAMFGGPHLHLEVITSSARTVVTPTGTKWIHGDVDPFPLIASNLTFTEVSDQTLLAVGRTYTFALNATDSSSPPVPVASAVQNAGENGGVPPSGGNEPPGFVYDPTRKVCVSSSTNALAIAAPDGVTTFAGIVLPQTDTASDCSPWGTTISSFALANTPATTVFAEYSLDPTVSVATDPLTGSATPWQLGPHSLNLSVTWTVTDLAEPNSAGWSGTDTLTIKDGNWLYAGNLTSIPPPGGSDPCPIRTEAGSGSYPTVPVNPTPPGSFTFELEFPASWVDGYGCTSGNIASGGEDTPPVTIVATPATGGGYSLSTNTTYPPDVGYSGSQLTVTASGTLN